MTLPVTAQAAFVATLVDEWALAGVTDAVVAPGSRSTPMALALAGDERIRVHVQLDERSAGFIALGIALASGRPAPVLTTSGSATAHLLPAVVEAHHAGVPMILCTADRPPELHDVGAPQTIEQANLYEGFLRWRADPGTAGDLPPGAWRSFASRAIAEAIAGPLGPGPVHLNLAFRDPLVASSGDLVPPGRPDGRPWHRAMPGGGASTPLAASLLAGKAGVITAGAGIGDPEPVFALARALGWPILADPRSHLRRETAPDGAVVVSAFDGILRSSGTAERLRPGAVLRLGAPFASKVTGTWLGANAGDQVVAAPFGRWEDPDRTASLVVAAQPDALCRSILSHTPVPAPDGWAAQWRRAEMAAQQGIEEVLRQHSELTEPGVARTLTRCLTADTTLLAASSMPVRDVEWYGEPLIRPQVLANRGANGIDGLVSTALGIAAGSSGRVVALLGDLAFLHDAGGLLGARRRGLDCTFVVVDNDGGGIFSFLPQAGTLPTERFEQLFGTPHGIDLVALAAVHGIEGQTVTNAAELETVVRESGVRLIRVPSDRSVNVEVHDELVAAVTVAVEGTWTP